MRHFQPTIEQYAARFLAVQLLPASKYRLHRDSLAVGALATVNHSNIEGVVKKRHQQNVEKKK
jgi:hypothetical protein